MTWNVPDVSESFKASLGSTYDCKNEMDVVALLGDVLPTSTVAQSQPS